MEVHHHSHTARKKWAHYFWEFFMLFLAVTLGFFVENQREHMVEHNREKQYIKSMIVDLNADTTKLSTIMMENSLRVKSIDSILIDYEAFASGNFSLTFFTHEWSLEGFTDFIYTDRTINQLKSSGGMRLIRKQIASDSIIAYDDEARDYLIEQDGLQRVYSQLEEQLNHLVNRRLLQNELKKDKAHLIGNKTIDFFLSHDKQIIESFYNQLDLFRNTLVAKKYLARNLKEKAVRLMAFLGEQYHLH